MQLAIQLAEKSGMTHPFKDGSAGCKWFGCRHVNLFRKSLLLLRANVTNPTVIADIFAKLGSIYA